MSSENPSNQFWEILSLFMANKKNFTVIAADSKEKFDKTKKPKDVTTQLAELPIGAVRIPRVPIDISTGRGNSQKKPKSTSSRPSDPQWLINMKSASSHIQKPLSEGPTYESIQQPELNIPPDNVSNTSTEVLDRPKSLVTRVLDYLKREPSW